MQDRPSDADSKVTRASESLPSEHSEIDSAAFVRQQRSPLLPRQQMSRSVDTNSEMPVAGVAIRQQHQWPYKKTAARQQQVSAVLPKQLPSGKTPVPSHPIEVSLRVLTSQGIVMHPEVVGPYRIERRLGAGGMGNVYLGIHTDTGLEAAVKVLPASIAREEGFAERFSREIQVLRQLSNRHVVALYQDGATADGSLYYAMEFVDGPTLTTEIQSRRRIPWPKFWNWLCRPPRHSRPPTPPVSSIGISNPAT
jgi:hypothetical protein